MVLARDSLQGEAPSNSRIVGNSQKNGPHPLHQDCILRKPFLLWGHFLCLQVSINSLWLDSRNLVNFCRCMLFYVFATSNPLSTCGDFNFFFDSYDPKIIKRNIFLMRRKKSRI